MINPQQREARRCDRCMAFTFAPVPSAGRFSYCSEACREIHEGRVRPRRRLVTFHTFTEVRLA